MRIVFHGQSVANYLPGFADLLEEAHEIVAVSDALKTPGEAEAIAAADVVVGIRLSPGGPALSARLFQVGATGTDRIDRTCLPEGCALCNVFGHEKAMAEYVMAALLIRHVPLLESDAALRQGDWRLGSGKAESLHSELGETSMGIVGYGHIGRTLAERARAFGMRVEVANRSSLDDDAPVDRAWSLGRLTEMAAGVDVLVNTLPLTEETRGFIAEPVFKAMRNDAVMVNVGRGLVVDEQALYDALAEGEIGGAVIDTWYVYPGQDRPAPYPAHLPFHDLPNVLMTPHMSGWTTGMIRRRREGIAENVNRLARGEALLNRLL